MRVKGWIGRALLSTSAVFSAGGLPAFFHSSQPRREAKGRST